MTDVDALLSDLRSRSDPVLARRLRARFKTPETVVGLDAAALKGAVAAWLARRGAAPTLAELDRLFGTGVCEARLAAMELALARRAEWDRGWADLFVGWAWTEETSWPVADVLGPKLLSPLWCAGQLAPERLEEFARRPRLWPWRTGMTALVGGLSRGDRDWPLLELFCGSCVPRGSPFHGERAAFNGVRTALRAALKGCPGRVRDFLDRHEPELPGYLLMAFKREVDTDG